MPPDNGPGRELLYPGSLRPNLVEHISYDMPDFLQAEGHIALACSADLETSSAALRRVLRECWRAGLLPTPTGNGGANVHPLHHKQTFSNYPLDDNTCNSACAADS